MEGQVTSTVKWLRGLAAAAVLILPALVPAGRSQPPASFAAEDLPAFFAPDFDRGDVALLAEELRLDEERRLLVDTLLTDYVDAFRAAAASVRDRIGRGGTASAEAGAGRRRALEAVRRQSIALREAARRAAETTDPEVRRRSLERFHERVDELQAKLREAGGDPALMTAAMERAPPPVIERAVREWEAEKAVRREAFLTDVEAVLTADQRVLWPRALAALRRTQSLPHGVLSAESLDLVRILRELYPGDVFASTVEAVLRAYGEALDGALRDRDEFLRAMPHALRGLDPLLEAGRRWAVIDRAVRLRVAVRSLNEEFGRQIAAELPDDRANRFIETIDRRAFAPVYRPTRVQRLFQAARDLGDLDEESLSAVVRLEADYRSALAAMNERLRRAILAQEPDAERARLEGRPDAVPDPTRAIFEERVALGDRHAVGLRGALGERQLERLPPILHGDLRDEQRGTRGLAGQDWIRERFDEDGDGDLSPAELEKLRGYLRRRRRHD